MIYFDNAATGGFKPRAAIDSAETVMKFLCANPGRSGHRLAVSGAEIVYGCRETFSNYFAVSPERVVFTKNCTEALNLAIFGTLKTGGHVITTTFEHNSVLRPLHALSSRNLVSLDVVAPTDDTDLISAIKEKITPKTYLIVCTAVSNVTGKVFPIAEIGRLAKENGLLFLVDGAQGGGHVDLNMQKNSISMLALAGHKGLCGIMGSGALLIDDSVSVEPLIYGGTGTESFNLNQPETYPEKLESGTLNLPAVAALSEGVKYACKNLQTFSENLNFMTGKIISALSNMPNVKVYSTENPVGIVSFSVKDRPSSVIADILNSEFDIAVRSGLHCAPLTHEFLGTQENGLTRVSLAVQNSSNEINYFLRCMEKLSSR